MVPGAKFPSLALTINNTHINLSRMTANGPEPLMRAPGVGSDPDIAVMPLDSGTWKVLETRKSKTAIDLDNWREPDWSKVRFGLANGYPDEHKKNLSTGSVDQVANQLITVVAELASVPQSGQRTITLSSALDNPHSWYFSGLSGGPLYVVEGLEEHEVEDDELFPVGIVFEGYPASGRFDVGEGRDATIAFLNEKDLFVRALALTPAIFDEWIRECGFQFR
jgi:hypothetical protein